MPRQPRETWCPYCRKSVDDWVARIKRKPRSRSQKGITIGSQTKREYACPHCKQRHPWWQYQWLQAVFLAVGILSVGAVLGFKRDQVPWIVLIGVAIAMILTLAFRFTYVWFVYRGQPPERV